MKKKMFTFVIYLIIIYLFISAIYVFLHIDFSNSMITSSPGFSEKQNIIRVLMGLPTTTWTPGYVSPNYMIQVILKIVLGFILLIFINKKCKK